MSRDAYGQKLGKEHVGTGGVFSDEAQYGKTKTEPQTASERIPINRDGHNPLVAQETSSKHSRFVPQQDKYAQDIEQQSAQPVMTDGVQQSRQTVIPDIPLNANSHSLLKTGADSAVISQGNNHGKQKPGIAYAAPDTSNIRSEPTPADLPSNADTKLKEHDAGAKFQSGKDSPLQHRDGANAPEVQKFKQDRKLNKAGKQLEKATEKLDKAKSKLPAKRKLKRLTYENEKTKQLESKLKFEKTPMPQSEHLKGTVAMRPVKAAANALTIHAHRKLYQIENENVGTKAAHRLEMAGEVGIRSALRHHKTAPYKKVARLEKKAAKKSVNLAYQKTLAQNPKLKSNVFKRAIQKHRIKRQYAKAARETQKAAKNAKKAGSAIRKIAQAAAKHPAIAVAIILVLALAMLLIVPLSTCSGVGSGITGAVAISTFLASDADMYAAEEAYAAMEADLQDMLDNYETLNPGYDEYRFDLDDIEHDPYVLMAILHALHDGEWTIGDVQGTLAMLFERQYILTETVTRQTRYRIVTNEYTDPYTGDVYEVDELEEYDYYICTVELVNFNLSHLPVYIMGETRLSRYALLMSTLGNRPDLFPTWLYPNASTYLEYEKYDIPPAYLAANPRFAAIIEEANKYLGMPYVWGGSNPSTSFDCSGFVSWVLNQTGWNVGRLGARGLHSYTTPVPPSQARPGDLIFFNYTYAAEDPSAATHVGIYVGDGMMVHCGNPIGYVSIETKYWQDHFLGFGRLP